MGIFNTAANILYSGTVLASAAALFPVFFAIGKFIALLAYALQWSLNLRIYTNVTVVQESWKIMRDFANMFFILIMIVMAYGTIFNIKGYDFRSLIPRFLIAVLLINFSLTICGLIIDGTQILNNVFLNGIGDMAGRLGQNLNPIRLLPDKDLLSTTAAISGTAGVATTLFIQLIFSIVLLFVYLISLAVPLFMAFIRIPILWALMIVSPVAWLFGILPSTKDAYNKWWRNFISWNLFLPCYLFFLYFGLYFLSNQDQLLKGLGNNLAQTPSAGLGIPVQVLFFYAMAAFFMIWGTKAALSASQFSGTGIMTIASWSKGVVERRIGVAGARQAAIEKGKEIQAGEGTLGRLFGGPPPGLETSRRLFGVRGAGIAPQKEFISSMDKEIATIKDQEVAGKVIVDDNFKNAALRENRSSAKGAAMRAVLYERGMIDSAEFDKDMTEWTQKNPFLAQKMSELAKKGKYKKIPGKQVLDMAAAQSGTPYEKYKTPGATASRKEWFSFAAEDDDALKTATVDHVATGVGLFGGKDSNDGKELIKKFGKKRPDIVAEFKMREDGVTPSPTQLSRYIFKEVKNKSPKELGEMLEPTWSNPAFQDALRRRVAVMQRIQPPVPAIPRGALGGPRKAQPGGGDTFKSGLKKSVQSNLRKLAIARTI